MQSGAHVLAQVRVQRKGLGPDARLDVGDLIGCKDTSKVPGIPDFIHKDHVRLHERPPVQLKAGPGREALAVFAGIGCGKNEIGNIVPAGQHRTDNVRTSVVAVVGQPAVGLALFHGLVCQPGLAQGPRPAPGPEVDPLHGLSQGDEHLVSLGLHGSVHVSGN